MRWQKHREAHCRPDTPTPRHGGPTASSCNGTNVPDRLWEARPAPVSEIVIIIFTLFFHALRVIMMTRPPSLCWEPPHSKTDCSWTLSPAFQSETDVSLFSVSSSLFTAPSLSQNNIKRLQNLAPWILGFDSKPFCSPCIIISSQMLR